MLGAVDQDTARGQTPPLKVRVWNGSERLGGYTTGVGKHVIHMVSGLARRPNVEVEFLVPRDRWARDQDLRPTALLAGVAARRHALSRRTAELLWLACAGPCLDDADTDWIYAPRERFAPARRARTIVTVHDVYAFEPAYKGKASPAPPLARAMLERALGAADIVATVSDFTAERVQALFQTRSDKIVVVGNGVEDHFFSPPTNALETFLPDLGSPYVLAVGGLTHKKGAPYLLDLARMLRSSAPHLTVAITGPVEKDYEADAAALSNVRLLGRGYTNEQLHALVAGAALLVVLSEYEGFGIPVLEAMAAGAPVIAARRAALPEIVGDGGILVEPSNGRAVHDAVIDALADTKARKDLIARARRRATGFSWGACVGRLHAAMAKRGTFSQPAAERRHRP